MNLVQSAALTYIYNHNFEENGLSPLSCLFPRKHNYVNLFRFSTSRDFEFVRL